MIAAILLLVLGVVAVLSTLNALRPLRNQWLALPSLAASWVSMELTVHVFVVQAASLAVLVWLGALEHLFGWVGLGLLVASWLAGVVLFVRSLGADEVVADALAEHDMARHPDRVPLRHLVVPFLMRRGGVERIRNIDYRRVAGRVQRLDLYRLRDGGSAMPVMVYLHGGAWTVGDKREQALPMLNHLAANGWLAISANYRLSPGATFPDHLTDAKAALAWAHEHAAEYGGDPSFVAVSGGSAGGHLAAMVALTMGDARYQPGFEGADTSVQAAVPLYGIYDFTNRLGVQYPGFVPMLLEPIVMKAFLSDEPERFRDASPVDLVRPDAPPFLVVQGDRDNLAPVEEARAFVAALRGTQTSAVVYMEFPGAQHAFDLAYSIRTARLVEGILSFLEATRAPVNDW